MEVSVEEVAKGMLVDLTEMKALAETEV